MARRLRLLLTCLPLLGGGPAASAEDWLYRVRPGDTIWDLAARYLRDPHDWPRLQALNRVADPHRLQPGSVIRLPLDWLRLDPVTARVDGLQGAAVVEHAAGGRAPLAIGDLVGRGDAIETAADAAVQLLLVDGSTLVIASSSRLELDRVEAYRLAGAARTAVDLVRGGVDTRVISSDRAASRLDVRTVPAVSSVRGTVFRTRVDEGGARAVTEVVEGRVNVAGAGRRREVAAAHGLVAQRGEPPPPPRPLLAPPPGAGLPTVIERLPVLIFAPPQPGAVGWRLGLLPLDGDAPLFERVHATPALRGPELPDGRYRVRLRAIDREGLESLDREWQVEIDARPEPPAQLRPTRDGRTREARPVFAWGRQEGVTAYRLQVAGDPGFAVPVVDLGGLATDEAVSPVALPEGRWYWRVAAVVAGDQGPFGDPQPFERRNPPAAAAEPEVNADRLVVRIRGGLPGQRYRFQLAEDRDFALRVVDTTLTEPELVYAKPLPGRYYLRTRVIDDDGYVGEFGPLQEIDVPPTTWWPAVMVPLVMLLLVL